MTTYQDMTRKARLYKQPANDNALGDLERLAGPSAHLQAAIAALQNIFNPNIIRKGK